MDTTFDYGYLRCIFGFAVGVACFRLHAARPHALRAPHAGAMTAAEVAVVAVVIAFVSAAGTTTLSFFAPFVFALAVLIFAIEGGAISRLFRRPLFHWLGTLSYSIYLTHALVVLIVPPVVKRLAGADLWTPMELAGGQYVMTFGRNDLEGTLLYALVLGGTVALSAFTYRWVETPGREWTRRWVSRPAAPATRAQPQRS